MRSHRAHTSSFIVLAFLAMFFLPVSQQVWPVCQKPHDAIDVIFGDGLQDDAAELVLKDPDLGAGFNLVLAAKLGRNDKLALGGKSGRYVLHALHHIISKTNYNLVQRVMSAGAFAV